MTFDPSSVPASERSKRRRQKKTTKRAFGLSPLDYQRMAAAAGLGEVHNKTIDRLRDAERRNRVRARKNGNEWEPVDFISILIGQCLKCCICGERMEWNLPGNDDQGITLEHDISLGQGGKHNAQNVKGAHRKCNIDKANAGDTKAAAKCKRVQGLTGQLKRRNERKADGRQELMWGGKPKQDQPAKKRKIQSRNTLSKEYRQAVKERIER